MKISYRRRWLLRRMDRYLCRSDPHLAAMFGIFGRLYASEMITSQGQASWSGARAWCRLAGIVRMTVHAAVVLIASAGRACCGVGRACAAMSRRLSRVVRAGLAVSPSARPPVSRGGTGLPAG
jgi:hypothetical protein